MHRFFISPENINNSNATIDDEQARHIERVLRLATGDLVMAFDGQGNEYELCLSGRQEGKLRAEIRSVHVENREPSLKITLVQGLTKGDKMDTIIQKAVEIGVAEVYPLISQHSVIHLDQKRAARKVERWQSIAREACKQCRRNQIPVVNMPIKLNDFLDLSQGNPVILLYENENCTSLKALIENNKDMLRQKVFLIVGPEGGFSTAEVSQAARKGALTAGLGPRILRTETAGLVASAILLYEMGDLE